MSSFSRKLKPETFDLWIPQTWTYRYAVAKSIRASAICSYKTKLNANKMEHDSDLDDVLERVALSTWVIAIRLLEDDEETVRNEASFLVSETVATSSNMGAISHQGSLSASQHLISTYAFECAFNYLTQHFSQSAYYAIYLFRLLGIQDSSLADLLQLPSSSLVSAFPATDLMKWKEQFTYLVKGESWGDFGDKLFEKEADNWYLVSYLEVTFWFNPIDSLSYHFLMNPRYEEPLLVVQVAAKHLRMLLPSWISSRPLLRDWLQQRQTQYLSLLSDITQWLHNIQV